MMPLRDHSLRTKVLLPTLILALGLVALCLTAVLGLRRLNVTIESVSSGILDRIALVDEIVLLAEQVQSDVYQASVLQSMGVPDQAARAVQSRLEVRLSDLNVNYGRLAREWDMSEAERMLLMQMRQPLDAFKDQSLQAAAVVIRDPAMGVMMVRSTTAPFEELQSLLEALRAHEVEQIAQAENDARAYAGKTSVLVALATLGITLAATLGAHAISRAQISDPILAMAATMSRMADGERDVDVPYHDRRDEIGDMARALDFFRQSLIARAEAEAALSESQRAMAALLQNLPGFAYRCLNDSGWTMSFVSDGFLSLTGYQPQDVVGNTEISYGQLIHVDDLVMVRDKTQMALSAGMPYQLEYRILAADGTEKWVWEQGSGLAGPDGTGTILEGYITDITDRKRAEQEGKILQEQLVQAQKMEAVGRLAGGIAHEFNNQLTVINGYCDILIHAAQVQHADYSELELILNAGRRAAELTHQMLAFGRRQMLQPELLTVNEVAQSVARVLQAALPATIQVDLDLDSQIGQARLDRGQMEQALLSLALNAGDAMPQGGTLLLRTRNVTWHQPFAVWEGIGQPGHYVSCVIADTGTGMSAQVLEHLFEPFYTTKGLAEGTGLGMSMVYGLVKQSHGYVRVDSKAGVGTSIELLFPWPADQTDPA